MAKRAHQAEEPNRPALKRNRPRRSAQAKSAHDESQAENEQGFRFDSYWDDAFSAYFDPTLRTCCQIRY